VFRIENSYQIRGLYVPDFDMTGQAESWQKCSIAVFLINAGMFLQLFQCR